MSRIRINPRTKQRIGVRKKMLEKKLGIKLSDSQLVDIMVGDVRFIRGKKKRRRGEFEILFKK